VAAAVAFCIAHDLIGHKAAFFAPVSAVVCLGTSYGQRLRRVVEVAVGVAVGVAMADGLIALTGRGAWQIAVVVALGMSVAVLLDTGSILVNQVAVQGIFIAALVPTGSPWNRWSDALIGGAVALVAATVVPAEVLRQPSASANAVLRKITELLRAAAAVVAGEPGDHGFEVLARARATDALLSDLRLASAEGLGVVGVSPFRMGQRQRVRRVAALVEPLERALRSTRVLVRMTAVAAHRGREVPAEYADLLQHIATAAEAIADLPADELDHAIPALLIIADESAHVPRGHSVSADATLVQLRTVLVDLLEVCGLSQIEATDALPRVAPRT
jgi:uncharacterized membrane protein YgaE (UPF0421/DUF939 family)